MKTLQQHFNEMSAKGKITKQDIDQHTLVLEIMKEGYKKSKKVYWFAYELIGFHKLKGKEYYMSYKGSTRVSELATRGVVESYKTEGKLHLYASCEVLDKII
jgi:choline kinase